MHRFGYWGAGLPLVLAVVVYLAPWAQPASLTSIEAVTYPNGVASRVTVSSDRPCVNAEQVSVVAWLSLYDRVTKAFKRNAVSNSGMALVCNTAPLRFESFHHVVLPDECYIPRAHIVVEGSESSGVRDGAGTC